MLTKNGICYNLSVSPYRYTVDYITFVFSSKSHLNKFKSKIQENRENINFSLSNRFNVYIDVAELSDVILYRKIETRGFLIIKEGEELWQNNLKYVGGSLTKKN